MEKNVFMKDFYVPMITPFTKSGGVDYAGIKKAVRHLEARGAEGIYAMGSSAECFLLTPDERKKGLEAVIDAAGGMQVIAHVGYPSADIAVDFCKHAKSAGACGITSVPPFYYRFSFQEIKEYYRILADAVDLPVMLYNIPATTGVSFSAEQASELLKDKRIAAMKFTEKDYYTMERIKAATGVRMYSGADECFLSALAAGADGAIGSTFNCMLDKFKAIKKFYEAGEMKKALETQKKANAVIEALIRRNLYAGIKYLMSLQGLDIEIHGRRPFMPLTEQEKQHIKKVYEENA